MIKHNIMNERDIWTERQQYFPNSYIGRPLSMTADSISSEELFKTSIKNKTSIPLWYVKSGSVHYKISKPIKVKIFEDSGTSFAENETLNIYGSGNSQEKALFDLGLHILYYFNYYKNIDENDLIGEGLKLKNLYDGLLVEI